MNERESKETSCDMEEVRSTGNLATTTGCLQTNGAGFTNVQVSDDDSDSGEERRRVRNRRLVTERPHTARAASRGESTSTGKSGSGEYRDRDNRYKSQPACRSTKYSRGGRVDKQFVSFKERRHLSHQQRGKVSKNYYFKKRTFKNDQDLSVNSAPNSIDKVSRKIKFCQDTIRIRPTSRIRVVVLKGTDATHSAERSNTIETDLRNGRITGGANLASTPLRKVTINTNEGSNDDRTSGYCENELKDGQCIEVDGSRRIGEKKPHLSDKGIRSTASNKNASVHDQAIIVDLKSHQTETYINEKDSDFYVSRSSFEDISAINDEDAIIDLGYSSNEIQPPVTDQDSNVNLVTPLKNDTSTTDRNKNYYDKSTLSTEDIHDENNNVDFVLTSCENETFQNHHESITDYGPIPCHTDSRGRDSNPLLGTTPCEKDSFISDQKDDEDISTSSFEKDLSINDEEGDLDFSTSSCENENVPMTSGEHGNVEVPKHTQDSTFANGETKDSNSNRCIASQVSVDVEEPGEGTLDRRWTQNPNKRRYNETIDDDSGNGSLLYRCLLSVEGQRPAAGPRPISAEWAEMINSPELWKTERSHKRRRLEPSPGPGGDEGEDYDELLEEVVRRGREHHVRAEGGTLYERRLAQRLTHPQWRHLVTEFDISPAALEVLHWRLTDEMSAQRCLAEVCSLRGWPAPLYRLRPAPAPGATLASCTIKGVTLHPPRPALSRRLARELAAAAFLDWLGVVTRDSRQDPVHQTYF